MEAAFNLAFWLVRSRPDAEDVVQEAYLRAFRAFDSFRGDDIRPWLLAIVRNTAYRWLSNRRRSGTVISLEEAFADGGGIHAGAIHTTGSLAGPADFIRPVDDVTRIGWCIALPA